MSGVIVSPDEPNPTHHISLSDGVTEIGLIAVKSDGSANALNIARGTPQRTALKTTSGDTTYSDFQAPWASIAQSRMAVARVKLRYQRSSSTRYADGYRINSRSVVVIPQDVLTRDRNQDSTPGSDHHPSGRDIGSCRQFLSIFIAETLSLLISAGTPGGASQLREI